MKIKLIRKKAIELGVVKPWPQWFNIFLDSLKKYKKKHGHCLVPQDYETPDDGYPLGQQIDSVRQGRRGKGGIKVPPERIKELDDLGFVWEPREERWNDFVDHLKEYKKESGNCAAKKSHENPDGYPLGKRLAYVRQGRRRGRLTPEKIEELDDLGFVWDLRKKRWDDFVGHLKAYKRECGDCNLKDSHECDDGYKLGQRARGIRQGRRGNGNCKVTPEMIKELDAIGFVWEPRKKGKGK